ncbi:BZ3500_MvSof-1268-A1-R1_Chr5-2g07751 [Microbotryum saponariae]|uniref:BZ3500_MvSof-1268-A1-R1_Chr5-2g07751 protein n=1 Tax=Microbotryum saponariae TaxID=289078 RepID=A0A2X0L0T8_9BASI|nr:BZ3500_MvSof-1268-A1-R1_Chr5-2g07751 [Microbotryum saponariae]SDA05620.1 BZ3501_MvSof-1269-A2-R1_Chr5-2g07573 [Microbotryum saponariae]
MSLLSDLVHLRTIESWAARAQQHQLQHGSPEGALSGAHVEGYSSRNPLAKERFLRVLVWSCDPNCDACSNDLTDEEVQKNRENVSATDYKQTLHRLPPLHPEPEEEEPGKVTSHFAPASDQFKTEHRSEWNDYFTDACSRLFCCLVCSERVFGHKVRWVPEHDIKREESGIWKVLTNSTLRTDLRPPTYDSSAWRGALIHPRGLQRPKDLIDQIAYSPMNNTLQCSLCPDCFKRLFPTTGPPTKPPRSLSNGFYRALDHVPADVRVCFSNASQLEHLFTARARAYKSVYKLTRFGDPKVQQEYTRRNTLIFSQNTASFTDVLSIGNPNLAELDKCRPMIVKQSRIQKMLRWLINESKNPAYSAVSFFNGERLAQLARRNSGVLNSTSPAPTAVSASTSASASVSVAPQVSDGQTSDGDSLVPDAVLANVFTAETVEPTSSLFEGYATAHNDSDEPVFEHVHVPPPATDEPVHSWKFFEKALRYFNHCKTSPSMSFRQATTLLWPHLDPFGLVGVCVERDVKISLEQQVKHWLNLYDSDFRCDSSFPFIISNTLRRPTRPLLKIYRISTVFWRFVQAHTYFNQARQAPHARFQFVPHRIRVHARNKPLFMQVTRTIN